MRPTPHKENVVPFVSSNFCLSGLSELAGVGRPYFILRCKPGVEQSLARELAARNLIEGAYVPLQTVTSIHRRHKRKMTSVRSVLPGYLFVQGVKSWPQVLGYQAVGTPIRNEHGLPYELDASVIDTMATAEQEGRFDKAGASLRVDLAFGEGDFVRADFFGTAIKALVEQIDGDLIKLSGELAGKKLRLSKRLDEIGAL